MFMQLSPSHFLKETNVPLLLLLNIVYLDEDSFHNLGDYYSSVGFPSISGVFPPPPYLSGSVSLEISTRVLESRTRLIVSIKPPFFSLPLFQPVRPFFFPPFLTDLKADGVAAPR